MLGTPYSQITLLLEVVMLQQEYGKWAEKLQPMDWDQYVYYLTEQAQGIERTKTLQHSNGHRMETSWQQEVTTEWHEFGAGMEL